MVPGGRGQPPGRSYIAQRSNREAIQRATHVDDLFEQRRQCWRENSDELSLSLSRSRPRRESQPMAVARREATNEAFHEEHDDLGGAGPAGADARLSATSARLRPGGIGMRRPPRLLAIALETAKQSATRPRVEHHRPIQAGDLTGAQARLWLTTRR